MHSRNLVSRIFVPPLEHGDSRNFRFAKIFTRTVIRKKKMATEDHTVILLLCFALAWLWRRRRQRRSASILRAMAARRRMANFRRRQEDELALITALMARRLLLLAVRQRRTIWVRHRSQAFLNDVVASWDDEEWKRNFRIGRPTFRFLCTQLHPHLHRRHMVRMPLSIEERVAITLWRLGTNIEYRSIAHLFGVGLSTVCVTVHEVCTSIVNALRQRYIRIPTGEDAQTVVDGFLHTWGFPQCFGAIDGSHIPILTPKDYPLDYYNRKGFHSIVLQALVDHEYKFMNIFVGWPGSCHDARILANSAVFAKGEAGDLVPDTKRRISGMDVPVVIL